MSATCAGCGAELPPRPCEWCDGLGRAFDPGRVGPCPDCGGTGKVREDQLVKLSEVVSFLERAYHVQGNKAAAALSVHPADAVQREFGGGR